MERPVLQSNVDRYVVVDYLAEGGMGAIYLGKKVGMEGFEKEVVLKQLLPEFTSQPEFIDLFLREAKLSASLDHANIVHTIDLVAAGTNYYIVMEYVRGGDLRTILRRIKLRRNTLDPAAALFVGREVLAALGYAHQKKSPDGTALNLIHRDVSPSNIMISGAGEVKLTDFGIAKASTHKSVFYRVKGKVGYMSPEQAYGDRPLDHRSDLYSMAVVLYEMLAGERLFVADLLSTPEQIYRQPIPPLEGRPGIPAGLDAVMRTALAIEPNNRYQKASEFLDALVQVAYDSRALYNPTDLAAHLREVCGDDPATWNQETDDEPSNPGTEVLPDDEISKVELTSVLTSFEELSHGVEQSGRRHASETMPGRLTNRSGGGLNDEPTRHVMLDATGMPLEVSSSYTDPRFDASDVLAMDDASQTLTMGSEEIAELSQTEASDPPQPEVWDEELTVAYHAKRTTERPPVKEVALASTVPAQGAVPVVATEPDAVAASDIDLVLSPPAPPNTDELPATEAQPSVPSVSAASVPAAVAPPAGAQPSIELPPVDGAMLSRRRRNAMIVAAAVLLFAAIAIVIVVGLSGEPVEQEPVSATAPDGAPERRPKAARRGPAAAPDQGAPAATPDAAVAVAVEKGSLTVESLPPRALVYLDGVRQCRAACTVEGLDPNHVYLLSVRRSNYVSWSRLIDMRGRKSMRVVANLSEEPDSKDVGYLSVQATPVADVSIDGARRGRVTSEGRIPLSPGKHEITLSHPRRRRKLRFEVMIKRQQITITEPMRF